MTCSPKQLSIFLLPVFLISLLLLVGSPCYAQDASLSGLKKIEVFYANDTTPSQIETLKDKNITVLQYNLDDHTNIEKTLSHGLPINDEAKALALVKQRLQRMRNQSKFDTMFHGAVLSKRYGLKKFPALVFNSGESVIYGVTDVSKGVSLWQAAQGFSQEGLDKEESAEEKSGSEELVEGEQRDD